MKKYLMIGFTALLALLMILGFAPSSNSQGAKETLSQGQAQSGWMSVSESYLIGPDDLLFIHVWGEEALSRTIPVRMDGKITMPLIDDVQATGLTTRQLKELLITRLKEFVESPNVTVMVVEANSYKVYVSGQVRTPGVYRLRSETSLLEIIPMAGGFTDWANQRKILIIRRENGREKRITVNYKKIVKGGVPDSDITLKPGDTVIVP